MINSIGAKWGPDQTNYLNIGLMVFSALLAFAYPFEVFLFAYTVMGPLHYLTEISWLHDRNYYTKGKRDYLFLVAVGVAVTVLEFDLFKGAPDFLVGALTFTAFVAALSFILWNNLLARLALVLPAIGLFFLLPGVLTDQTFGVFLPTLIHVFVFTGFFILVGALRAKSLSGILSLLAFVGIAVSFTLVHPTYSHYLAGPRALEDYGYFKDDGTASNPFIGLNFQFIRDFHLHDFGTPTQPVTDYLRSINEYLYQNPLALALMSFIAFAYTYHYFNWFSKTSIIRWHEVPKRRMATIGVLWVCSLVLSAYNYSLGFKVLFFLSFTHVLLEFPLNHLTFIGIGKELKKATWRAATSEREAV